MTYQTSDVINPNGDSLEMDRSGNTGPVVLFVHGWTCRRAYWAPQMADLARDHRVATLDLSGHGGSGHEGRTDWTVHGLADDVLTALDALGEQEAVLVGHSMGGAVTLEAAARTPSVRGVVLVDSFVLPYGDLTEADAQGIEQPFQEDFATAMAGLVDNTAGPAMDGETRERLKREMAEADIAWALPLWHNLLRWSPESAFGAITAPIHAINGDLIPEPAKQRCAGRVTEWHMPGTGHFPQMEMPEAFNRKLREVLAAL